MFLSKRRREPFLSGRAAGALLLDGGASPIFVSPARFGIAPVSGSGLISTDYRD
jgi:hypothetical protein